MTSKHINIVLWVVVVWVGAILGIKELTQTAVICATIWTASSQDDY